MTLIWLFIPAAVGFLMVLYPLLTDRDCVLLPIPAGRRRRSLG